MSDTQTIASTANRLDDQLYEWAKEVFTIITAALEEARKDPRHEARAQKFIDDMVADGCTPRHDLGYETDWFARMTVEKNLPDIPPLPALPSWAERWVTRVTTSYVVVSAVSTSRTYRSWDAHLERTVIFDRNKNGEMDIQADPLRVEVTVNDDDQIMLTTADTVEISRVIIAAGIDLANALATEVNA